MTTGTDALSVDVTLAGFVTSVSGPGSDSYVQNAQGHATALGPLLAQARHILRDGDTVFDVGANIGLSTIGLARLVPDGRVFAFEPSALNAAWLRHNLARNGLHNVVVIEAAASDATGRLYLTDTAGCGAASYVTLSSGAGNVDAIDLDGFAAQQGVAEVALLKIDVEGHEPWVLAGAKRLIEVARPKVWMEFNAWCLMAFGGVQPIEFAAALFDAFSAVTVEGASLVPVGDAVSFVHRNIVEHGCVTDLLLALRDAPMPALFGAVPAGGGLTSRFLRLEAESAQLRRRCGELERDVAALKASTSWRITRPLRALKGAP